jgi:hypothetical protein
MAAERLPVKHFSAAFLFRFSPYFVLQGERKG